MHSLKNAVRRTLIYILAVTLVGSSPAIAFAQTAPSTPPPETKEAPKNKNGYTYDPVTGRWSNANWQYDATSGTYKRPTPPPAPAPDPVPAPVQQAPTTANPITASVPQENQAVNTPAQTEVNQETTIEDKTSINTDTKINNKLDSNATTGNAAVTNNTTAGNATSGNASANATIINAVHSTVEGDAAGVAHFTIDIEGDVVGDIMLYPAIDGAKVDSKTTINSDTKINNNNAITNDVNLNATSGNANVKGNTNAGDATSGNAHTVANVMNLVNSIIAANKSFIGTINIHGNLNGDILISPEFIPQLLGSNSSSTSNFDGALSMELNNNQTIINNIKLNAESGNANVSGNTTAGTANTGDAQTNLTVLNLTGREVNAKNSLLVFVNVLGKWVGMIVDAPGATAAALGNDVTKNTTVAVNGSLVANENTAITNNINLASQSGDANVSGNTTAGDANTGNATASANIANISTSTFQVNDWFGLLFINVFDTWIGSFGIDTESGNLAVLPEDTPVTTPVKKPGAPNIRLGFVPRAEPPVVTPAQQQIPPVPARTTLTLSDIPETVLEQGEVLAAAMKPAPAPVELSESKTPDVTTHGVKGNTPAEDASVKTIAFIVTMSGIIGTAAFGLIRRLLL
jgi:outer membrane biosynthesis protein TonB